MEPYHQRGNGMVETAIRHKRAEAERIRDTDPGRARYLEAEAAAFEEALIQAMKGGKSIAQRFKEVAATLREILNGGKHDESGTDD